MVVDQFFVKSSFLASFTHSRLLVRSYSRTTNRSRRGSHCSMHCTLGVPANAQNAGVTESYNFQVFHEDLLLFPPKKDIVSHPVTA